MTRLARRKIMSKRMKRIALSVLLSLAVVAGIYTSVLGASLNTGSSARRLHVNAGLTLDLGHQREAAQSLDAYVPQQTERSGHNCEDEAMNPSDY